MDPMAYQKKILEKVIIIEGSGVNLAKILKVNKRHVSMWKCGDRKIPLKHCLTLSAKYEFINLRKLLRSHVKN